MFASSIKFFIVDTQKEIPSTSESILISQLDAVASHDDLTVHSLQSTVLVLAFFSFTSGAISHHQSAGYFYFQAIIYFLHLWRQPTRTTVTSSQLQQQKMFLHLEDV